MTPFDLGFSTLQPGYADGSLTPFAVAEEVWRRCDEADPAIWIHRLPREQLLRHAERIAREGAAGKPLYGLPFAIKDNIDLAGAPTTAACPEFSYVPEHSAQVVERLLNAGALPVGKTNLDQFATGLVGVRSPYGIPKNPFAAHVIPGGSSSGSAVAVSTGLVSFSLGTDTAGSGRIPAGLNHLVGLKPTRGAVSNRGVVPACRSLDCVSFFTRTPAEAAAVHAVASRYDPADPFSRPNPGGTTVPVRLRVGIPAATQLDFDGDAEAQRLFATAVSAALPRLKGDRVQIDYTAFRDAASLLYQGPWVAERWADLRSFYASHPESFHPVTRRVLEPAAGLRAADVFAGQHRLAALARASEKEWDQMDVLLLPTAPRPYTLAEVEASPLAHNTRLGTYTNFVNLLDLSAIAVPAGFRSDGVPWGVTLIARAWQEPLLLALASQWMSRV